jgi:hypothetical protein
MLHLIASLLGLPTWWTVTLRARQRDGAYIYRTERVVAHSAFLATDAAAARQTDTDVDWYAVRAVRA